MQDVVKQAIHALEERHANPRISHPDAEGAFILCKFLKKAGLELTSSLCIVEEFYKQAETNRSKDDKILMGSNGEYFDPFAFQEQCFDVWDKVDNNLETLQIAIRKAHFKDTPETAKGIPDADTIFLAKVCRELQEMRGDGFFFLSHDKAGEAIGKSRPAGAARLKALMRHGVIKLVKASSKRKANEYTFLTSAK